MYEYTTTTKVIQWSSNKPKSNDVNVPEGEGWEVIGFAVENMQNTSILWWTWKRKRIEGEILSE